MQRVSAKAPFDPEHPHALVVTCSDGRFTRAVEELLATLGEQRLDTLTMPGGPALLNLATARASDRDSVGRAASFLIRSHGILSVVLVAHEGCGYYRERFGGRSAEELLQLQVGDLKGAARVLELTHPGLQVRTFLARVAGSAVTFVNTTG